MIKYTIYVLFIATLIVAHDNPGKKPRRSRRPKNEEDTTLQPSVISYSTFGFNDVGSYDGFVPTSPDYANYLSNQESSTRLYAPAFPSAPDATGFNSDFGQFEGYGNNDDGGPQSSMLQYPQSSMNFFSTPTFDNGHVLNKNMASNEAIRNAEEMSGSVYGTKLSSKNKQQKPTNSNNTEFHVYSSGPVFESNESFKEQDSQIAHKKNINTGESPQSDQNIPSYNIPNYPSSDVEEFVKAQTNPQNSLKFPRVVDFTNLKKYYPTELDDKYKVSTYSSILNNQNNMFSDNNENQSNQFISPTQRVKEPTSFKTKLANFDGDNEKENTKPNIYTNSDYSPNYIKPVSFKNSYKNPMFDSDSFKDNYKHKWTSENGDDEAKNNKIISEPFRGYQYSTDYSNTSFKYDFTPDKPPFKMNIEEPTPASSNIDLNYHAGDTDYSSFKKIPEVNFPFDDEFDSNLSRDKFKTDEYLNQFKNLYTTTPSTKWGNSFKSSEFSLPKHRVKRPQYEDSGNNDMVHIPKRPSSSFKFNIGNSNFESKINDHSPQRPYKSNKYEKPREWNKEVHGTRFKSEEDLLDLRNHDTSHPSYLPSHRPSGNDLLDDTDYKKLVEKWRHSYLKSKYRDSYRDYDSYASEEKPIHVPIPKPYSIEVPHPVIVPVPQPYPVRVPIPKPVAVPIVKELTVPVEKPVPYPVYKNVPYPVEKIVLVPVEKEVKVPVIKPYPVHVPHVRPVFHHSRPPRDEYEAEADDDDYLPRPEGRPESSKRPPPSSYRKRPKSPRSRPRRPTRMPHHERNTSRRRWPTSQRPSKTRSRPFSKEYHAPYRHHDYEPEREYESEHTDYYYCKRTGNC